jgi:hypothetical protein
VDLLLLLLSAAAALPPAALSFLPPPCMQQQHQESPAHHLLCCHSNAVSKNTYLGHTHTITQQECKPAATSSRVAATRQNTHNNPRRLKHPSLCMLRHFAKHCHTLHHMNNQATHKLFLCAVASALTY